MTNLQKKIATFLLDITPAILHERGDVKLAKLQATCLLNLVELYKEYDKFPEGDITFDSNLEENLKKFNINLENLEDNIIPF